jgi:hypothetical protein
MARHLITVTVEVEADDPASARAVVRMLMPLGQRVFGRLGTVKAWAVVER